MMAKEAADVVFQETQAFRQPWLWIIVFGSLLYLSGLFAYGLFQQLCLGKPWGTTPCPMAR